MHIILFPKAIREKMVGMVGKATEEDGLEEADFEVNNGKELGFKMVNLVNYLRDSGFGYEMQWDAGWGWCWAEIDYPRRLWIFNKILSLEFGADDSCQEEVKFVLCHGLHNLQNFKYPFIEILFNFVLWLTSWLIAAGKMLCSHNCLHHDLKIEHSLLFASRRTKLHRNLLNWTVTKKAKLSVLCLVQLKTFFLQYHQQQHHHTSLPPDQANSSIEKWRASLTRWFMQWASTS